MTGHGNKDPRQNAGIKPRSAALEADQASHLEVPVPVDRT